MNILGLDVTETRTEAEGPAFKLGTIAGDIGTNGPQKSYKYVQYSPETGIITAVAGRVAYYSLITLADATATIVTSDVSLSMDVGAGVLQANIPDEGYGWVQILGLATLTATVSGSDGDSLTPMGATDGNLVVVTALTDNVCAVAIDASAEIIMCCFPH